MVANELARLFDTLRARMMEYDDYLRRSEYNTRILLIDPVLRKLGWDVEDPELVRMEVELARPKGLRADYVLLEHDVPVAIVEAKSFGRGLEDDRFLNQAAQYAGYAGVSFFVLTDGNIWRLYRISSGKAVRDLQPEIEFYTQSNNSANWAKMALALRRPSLDLGRPTDHKSNLIFRVNQSTERNTRPAARASSPPPERSLWCPISELSIDDYEQGPSWIRFPDRVELEFVRPGWIGVPFNIARWLVDTGQLCNRHLPVKLKGKMLISATSLSFGSKPREVRPGFWMNRQQKSDAHLYNAVGLLQRFGIDPATVFINFGDLS